MLQYSPEASAQLDLLQAGPDDDLWNAVCDVLDLIADRPDSSDARRETLRTQEGNTVWCIPVRHKTSDNFCVLWSVQNDIEYVLYVGTMPVR